MKEDVGHVYLVGAGPGPVDLLTVRARRLIRTADVIAYDDLIHPSLLNLARSGCQLLAIGYRAGATEGRPPPLHPEALRLARSGAKVVRLKAGDPLIFARGGEEALALEEAGIPYSIVPGITSALAAGASCRLPLTWRGQSSELCLSTRPTAHDEQAGTRTIALYMPRHGLEEWCAARMAAGWSSDTPAAFIMAASQPQEICIRSRLGTLAHDVAAYPSLQPGLVLLGPALNRLASRVSSRGKLAQRCILLARATSDRSEFKSILEREGADVWEIPWIKTRRSLVAAWDVNSLGRSQAHIIVPSASAWDVFRDLCLKERLDIRCLHEARIITLGPQARRAVQRSLLEPWWAVPHRTRLPAVWPTVMRDRPCMILGSRAEVLSVQSLAEAQGLSVIAGPMVEQEVQYPRLPLVQADLLIVPHRRAWQLLQQDAAYLTTLRHLPMLACGTQLAHYLREQGASQVHAWAQADRKHLTTVVEDMLRRFQQREDDDAKRTFDSLHGAWQG
jgi:uroporphyrin-III C-methyltransferase